MTLIEMEGFLRGKCLPGDILVGETNAQYLLRKLNAATELQRQLTAYEATVTNLTAQVQGLAAENAALKATNDDRRTFIMNGVQLGYIKVPTVETDPALETIRIAVSPQEPTPATDAALAEIRAQGVEMFVSALQKHVDEGDFVGDEIAVITGAIDAGGEFSDKLREEQGK